MCVYLGASPTETWFITHGRVIVTTRRTLTQGRWTVGIQRGVHWHMEKGPLVHQKGSKAEKTIGTWRKDHHYGIVDF